MYVASLVLGIVSLIFSWIPFINVILAIIALIISIVAMVTKKEIKKGRGMGIAGTILSSIALFISIVYFVLIITIASKLPGAVKEIIPKIKEEINIDAVKDEVEKEAMLATKYVQIQVINKENEYTGYIDSQTEKYVDKEKGISIEKYYEDYLKQIGYDCNVSVSSDGTPSIEN